MTGEVKHRRKYDKEFKVQAVKLLLESGEGEYIAYYKSDFLDATYSVYFRDLCFIKHKSLYVV